MNPQIIFSQARCGVAHILFEILKDSLLLLHGYMHPIDALMPDLMVNPNAEYVTWENITKR